MWLLPFSHSVHLTCCVSWCLHFSPSQCFSLFLETPPFSPAIQPLIKRTTTLHLHKRKQTSHSIADLHSLQNYMGLAWSSAKFTLLFQVTSKCYRLSHQRTCRNPSVSLAVVPSCHLNAFHPTTSHACLNSFHAPSSPLSLLRVCTPWPPIKVHPTICVAENLIWSSNWQKTNMELGRGMGGEEAHVLHVCDTVKCQACFQSL